MAYNILNINSSMNPSESKTGQMADYFVNSINHDNGINQTSRDLTQTLPLIDQKWIGAAFTPNDDRSDEQLKTLQLSDALIDEINEADHIVLSVPMYNFTIPANVKTWFDHIARVGKTFKYTDQGPVGLVNNKPVSVFVASGGTPIESPIDFLTPYVKQFFAFIGITNVHVIAASDQYVDDIDNHIKNLN